jgi:hypothetical protein
MPEHAFDHAPHLSEIADEFARAGRRRQYERLPVEVVEF